MSRLLRARAAPALLALLPLLSACAPETCSISTVGDMPILNEYGSPIVRVTLNGKPAAMIVDTGANVTSVWTDAAKPYGPRYTNGTIRSHGVQGDMMTDIVMFDTLGLGSASVHDLAVTSIDKPGPQGTINGLPIVGLFGANFLTAYDTVIDMRAHRFNLYQIAHCGEYKPGWSGKIRSVPYTEDARSPSTMIPFSLNGHAFTGELDTGSSTTVISEDDARDAGLTRAYLHTFPSVTLTGIGTDKTIAYRVPFDTLKIGSLTIHNMTVTVADSAVGHTLIGADLLRFLRIWVGRNAGRVYFQFAQPQTAPPPDDPINPAPVIIRKAPPAPQTP